MGLLNKTAFLGIVLLLVIGGVIAQAPAETSGTWNNFIKEVEELFSKLMKVCEQKSPLFPPPMCGLLKNVHDNMGMLSKMIYDSMKNFNDKLPDTVAQHGEPLVKMLSMIFSLIEQQ